MDKSDLFAPFWTTTDVGLAAALLSHGFDLIEVEINGFTFEIDEKHFNQTIEMYRSGKYAINGRDFYVLTRVLHLFAESQSMKVSQKNG